MAHSRDRLYLGVVAKLCHGMDLVSLSLLSHVTIKKIQTRLSNVIVLEKILLLRFSYETKLPNSIFVLNAVMSLMQPFPCRLVV